MSLNNSVDSISQVIEIARKNKDLTSVTIELLTKCNWRCKHCYIPDYYSEGLSMDTLFRVFEELRALGCFEIVFTGGEMFCRDDAIEIIRRASELGFKVILFTNASLLNSELIAELSRIGISQLSCTLFSMNDEIHDSITQVKGSHEKLMHNLMEMKKYEIPVEVKTIFMKDNNECLHEIHLFCKDNEFIYKPDVTIFYKNNGESDNSVNRLTVTQLEVIVPVVDTILGYQPKIRECDELLCPSISNALFIDAVGDVYPCNRFFIKLGNILEESIENIWRNSELIKKLRGIKWGDNKECMNCEYMKFCVKCPGISLVEEGDSLIKSSSACIIAKVRHSLINPIYQVGVDL